jgi:hypothetical protein
MIKMPPENNTYGVVVRHYVLSIVTKGKSKLWQHVVAANEEDAVAAYVAEPTITEVIKRHGKGIVICGEAVSTQDNTGDMKCAPLGLHVIQVPQNPKLEIVGPLAA